MSFVLVTPVELFTLVSILQRVLFIFLLHMVNHERVILYNMSLSTELFQNLLIFPSTLFFFLFLFSLRQVF